MELSLKTNSFIFISLLTIFINFPHCADPAVDPLQECKTWNDYCDRAQAQPNNHFRCINEAIYFYEPEPTDWDEARNVCYLKFGGSFLADLIQIPDDKRQSTIDMFKNLGDEIKATYEIATGGACCMRKYPDSVREECEWLSTGEKISEDFYTRNTVNKCQILTITFDGTNLKASASYEKSKNAKLRFLCSFNLPQNCKANQKPTTNPPTTTEKVAQNTNEETKRPQTKPTDDSKDTTVSIPKNPDSTEISSEDIDPHLEGIHNEVNDPNGMNSIKLVEISEKLKNLLHTIILSKNSSLMLTMEIVTKMEQLSTILDINFTSLSKFSHNVVESVSKVLDSHYAWEKMENTIEKINMSSTILKLMQSTGFKMGCKMEPPLKSDEFVKIRINNIIIKSFPMDFKNITEFSVAEKMSSITLPAGIPEPELVECQNGIVVGSMFDKLSQYLSDHLDDHQEINSNIVAFSIRDTENSTQLPDGIPNVKIVVEHNKLLELGDSINCVYWDFDEMKWSSKGCRFQQINSNRKLSICECNHLTNFAALMDVSGRETDTKVKDILTKVCCGLSIVCLILTIGLFTGVRALRNRRNNITSNLCICLLIVNLLIVFGMDSTQNNILCQTVAAFLLYFILCSFSWMLMEGYHLYQMIVLVFSNVGHLRLIYMYAIGYGAPLLIAFSAYLGIGFKNLKETDSYFCWISSPSHPYRVWAVAGPATVAIMANFLIMILALKEAFSAKIKKKLCEKDFNSDSPNIAERLAQSFSWIKGFISLVVVLGITWISFLLYIHRFGQFFSYIFIILNGLQGVFIFVFQILLNEKARSVARKTCQKRLPSRYLSSLYRTTSTNVTSMRSKSFSKDKSSTENLSSNNVLKRMKSSNDANHASIASHRSQSISMDRIRNASDSILF